MKALAWHGTGDVRIDTVPDPEILHSTDCILKVTLTAICGSDLHLYDGYIPTMEDGDILGHEFMGEVVEVGADVTRLRKGDRVVIPFPIACGQCFYCSSKQHSLCDNSNPNRHLQDKAYGYGAAGIFGYSHLMGGFAGGQAEYVRVPYADVGPFKVPDSLSDEQVLFLTDIYPTGYQAAENCDIQEGDTVAVWGAGPVGLFAALSARLMGARVIAIDRFPERLAMARRFVDGVITLDYEETDVMDALRTLTNGRGPDACIDAVGMEAHSTGLLGAAEKVQQTLRIESDRGAALRSAIQACRKGGIVSIPGVYGGIVNQFNIGAAFNKGLQFRMGQTHVHRYMPDLLAHIEAGRLDPSYIITHRAPLGRAPEMYETFRDKKDACVKVVLDPALPDTAEVETRTAHITAEA